MTPHDPARVLRDGEHDGDEDHEAKEGDESAPVAVPRVHHEEELTYKGQS